MFLDIMMCRGKVVLSCIFVACFLQKVSLALVSPSRYKTCSFVEYHPASTSALFVAKEGKRADATTSDFTPPPQPSSRGSRLRRLRDLMWVREALEDLTAAEFAISLDQTTDDSKRRKRAVDYEKMLGNLNRRIMDLGCEPNAEECDIDHIVELSSGQGMGSLIYSDEQRDDLFNRILQTRYNLIETMKNDGGHVEEDSFGISLPEINIEIPKEENMTESAGPKLYVRDDGTVDWDGALQDQAALTNFGTAVWARINGRDPEQVLTEGGLESTRANGEPVGKVTAKIEDTEEIRKELELLTSLESEYRELERNHLALLNSAISAGQAVANINLATLDSMLRRRINESSEALDKKREEVLYQRLIYELERIYTYLAGEMSNPSGKGYIPLQDRLNVAEFGLLESQISSFKSQLEAGEHFDADVLAVVSDQLIDFKRRLGIDYYVAGLTFDREAIQQYFNELLEKTRKGLAFYVKGCKLLWNDLVYATSLILRALQGYTLKPREVRNLRRTFKDLITFVPVIVILLIPLSPVGHVLVFGAIQRVFPDFFPSCFTERRQNLLQLYETAEYSELTINETFREKITRFLEAFFFQIAKYGQMVLSSLQTDDDKPTKED